MPKPNKNTFKEKIPRPDTKNRPVVLIGEGGGGGGVEEFVKKNLQSPKRA